MDHSANSLPNVMTSQFMGVAMMKDNISITQLISAFIIMQLCAFIPQLKQLITNYLQKKFTKVTKQLVECNISPITKKVIKSKITFIKNDKKKENDIIIDAINYHIINLESSKYLTYFNDFFVTNDEEFEIANEVYCAANTKMNSTEEATTSIDYNLQIYSYSKSLYEIKIYIDKLKEKYIYEQRNKLGNKKYFFDENHVTLPKEMNGEIRFAVANPNMIFKMTQFNTNKSLSNIFGNHLCTVKDRIQLFIEHPEWYEEKGIPYTLGIMLHGPPGTGKTSLIKAIAKDTKRHIFNIKLYKDTTQSHLRNLFFNESVSVLNHNKTETYNIPLDERIYVIEDIDCLTDVIKERSPPKQNQLLLPPPQNGIMSDTMLSDFSGNFNDSYAEIDNSVVTKPQTNTDELTLSFLLNLLDGILETPGRILIITTNKPETLDKAFIRPGRIDINIEVGYCTVDMIKEMFNFFFNIDNNNKYTFDVIYNNKITPAELNKLLLDNISSETKAYASICEEMSRVKYTY